MDQAGKGGVEQEKRSNKSVVDYLQKCTSVHMYLQGIMCIVGTWSQDLPPFASLKKQAETLFRLICCERKTLFRLKKKLKKTDYKRSEQSM